MKSRLSAWETKDSILQAIKKSVGIVAAEETPSLTGEFVGETHRLRKCTQTHPLANPHLKGHKPLVGSEGSDRKWDKSEASSIVPSLTPPSQTAPAQQKKKKKKNKS